MTDEQFDPDLVGEQEPDDGLADAVDENSPLLSLEELRARVARLVELRKEKDETATAAKKAEKEFKEFQAEFFEEYEKSPLKGSIKVEVGDVTVQLVPRKTKFGRILDYDKAVEYFKSRNKDKEYIKDDFRMGRVHELVREHIEQKKPLPPGLDFYTKEYFTMTIKD
jgi:hypothetical protein